MIGILVDSLVFGKLERSVLARRGLLVDHDRRADQLLVRRELAGAAFGR